MSYYNKINDLKNDLCFQANNFHKFALIKTGSPILVSSFYAFTSFLILKKSFDFFTTPKVQKKAHKADCEPLLDGSYDVLIIGAGPAGSVAGYHLAQNGVKVVMIDKKKFPRDKICGDAVTTIAQNLMREMGINLGQMVQDNEAFFAQNGGFVSPGGCSFISNSAVELNRGAEGAACAIKRIILDDKLVKASVRGGTELIEELSVEEAEFQQDKGYWKVRCETNDKKTIYYFARVIIAADGAPSRFARSQGIVKTEPQSVCSRSYITGEHAFNGDGVVFYPRQLLPGYCALFRHSNNELGYCCYIIPGGPTRNEDLTQMHHSILEHDPFVSVAARGNNIEIEPMKAGALRLGGIEKSYADHLLVIGDAAGFIDPLTGEGIQYAMESGKFAAQVIAQALINKNLSEGSLKRYQDIWYKAWGREFVWSMRMSLFLYRFPIFLDGAALLIRKRGAKFLADWAEVMTGSKSKLWFLRPDVGPLIMLEVVGLAFKRLFGRKTH
eukprot:TRINITY_DN281_c0_g1_i1.p1 TRINITY_DN281_c0_g1~~TRINITY_DN281_c0_g1_i1.p1  ORF type:complete len:498 (-),score=262.92 TRINITY_DN281_c0_g1_i1:143-1636(-)